MGMLVRDASRNMIEQWLIGAMALAVVSLFIHVHSLLALTGEAPRLLS